MPIKRDLAIRWNDRSSSIRRIQVSGMVPIHAFPHHFKCSGGIVALVGADNLFKLSFRAADIVGPTPVKLADGKVWPKGYLIKADKRTIRRLGPGTTAPFRGWYAIGQFRYFNAAKMRAVLVGQPRPIGNYLEDFNVESLGTAFHNHVQGIPGLPRRHPEAVLVDHYVSWVGDGVRFGHNYIREAKLFVDLFDLTHWQLLEAKAAINRETIRMAIGQLRDYKRFYPSRRPSLAVLLPLRPSKSCIKLLVDNHIAVIWRTPGGRFASKKWQDG